MDGISAIHHYSACGRSLAVCGGDCATLRHYLNVALGGEVADREHSAGEPIEIWIGLSGDDVVAIDRPETVGTYVYDGDEPTLRRAAQNWIGRGLSFGRGADCDISAAGVTFSAGCLQFRVGQQSFQVSVLDRTSLKAVLAAVAVARIYALPMAHVAERLAQSRPVSSTRRVSQRGSLTIVHDTADATAETVRRALDLLREFPANGERIIVCGALTDVDETACRTLGAEVVTRCGADRLVACGPEAEELVAAAHAAGMPRGNAVACATADELAQQFNMWCGHSVTGNDDTRTENSRSVSEDLHDRFGTRSAPTTRSATISNAAIVLLLGGPTAEMSNAVRSIQESVNPPQWITMPAEFAVGEPVSTY